MNTLLERRSYDTRQREIRRLAVVILALLVAGIAWHWARNGLVYHAARSSVGCPGRWGLIAAELRQVDPEFPNDPQRWSYDAARPEWIAWPSVREIIRLEDGSNLTKWQVKVADRNLALRGVFTCDRLSIRPADADRDGSCEVMKETYAADLGGPYNHLRWWTVVRLGEKDNEVVWAGMIDTRIWRSRRVGLKPIWRDTDGDGMDELVFITIETARTPDGGIVYKTPQTIAVFEWTAPGGILRTRLLPDDCGILPWNPEGHVPMRIDQATDLDVFVRELLPAADSR